MKNKTRAKRKNGYTKTDHHCLAKHIGGSNSHNNIKKIEDWQHQILHRFFGTLLPHLCLLITLKLVGKPLQEEVKDKLEQILTRDAHSLYKPGVIKNKNKFKNAIKDLVWIQRI